MAKKRMSAIVRVDREGASPLDDAGETFARREGRPTPVKSKSGKKKLCDNPIHRLVTDLLGTTTPAGIAVHDPDAIKRTGKAAPAKAGERQEGQYRPLAISAIRKSPTNPRQDFDEESLTRMAHGITLVGVGQPVIVRAVGDGSFELVAGERRWRAAKIAGLKEIPARIVDVSDQEAVELQARENLDREDLNAIERARQYQMLLEHCHLTQEALAQRFDLSQGEISNTVRLLELPEVIQQRIISQEITPTQARDSLLKWRDRPDILERFNKGNPGDLRDHDLGWDLDDIAQTLSREMRTNDWINECRRFEHSREILKQLDVRKVGGNERAFNLELYDRLQAAATGKAEKREAHSEKAAAGETAAERRAKAEKLADQLQRRIRGYYYAWLQQQIAGKVAGLGDDMLFRLLLHFAVDGGHGVRARSGDIEQCLRSFGDRLPKESWDFDSWKLLSAISGEVKMRHLAVKAVTLFLQHDLERFQDFDHADIARFARELKIDVAKDWQLDKTFLGLHTSGQLCNLADEWGIVVAIDQGTRRPDLIEILFADSAKLKCPKSLLAAAKAAKP